MPPSRKKKAGLFTVTQQEWVLHCSTEVQMRDRMEVHCQTVGWHSPKYSGFSLRWVSTVLYTSTNSVGRQRKRAICWVTAVTREHQVQTCKTHPRLLLTFRPPAPRFTLNWRYEYMNNRSISDKVIAKAKSVSNHKATKAPWHVNRCVCVRGSHTHTHTLTHIH